MSKPKSYADTHLQYGLRKARQHLKRRGLLRAEHTKAQHRAMLKMLRGGDATESGGMAHGRSTVAEPPASVVQEARRLKKIRSVK